MIYIYNVEVPFIIRNNEFTSSGISKDAITILFVNGSNSKVINNRFTRADNYIYQSNNVSFIANKMYLGDNHIRESSNISLQYNFFDRTDLDFYDCSDIVLHNNTFDFRDSGSKKTLIGYETNFTRYTNNTFFDFLKTIMVFI